MFHNFSNSMTNVEEKALISWIQDIYKHLKLNENNNINVNLFNMEDNILVELGILNAAEDLEEFKLFFKKVKGIEYNLFLQELKKINHEDRICIIPKLCKRCRSILKEEFLSEVNFTLVDLFCGAGGMSLGFNQENFKTIFANDIEDSCIQTYILNHPEVDPSKVVLGDIKNLASTVNTYIEGEQVDVLIGGPPCQGFSLANQQRVIDDPRNKLYKEYVSVVNTTRPKFFVMENVEGMKSIANQIEEDFQNIGYTVKYQVLNAIDFGVPQNRKRIIFIGNRLDIDNQLLFDELLQIQNESPRTTLYDAIHDLPSLEPLRIKNATEHESDECGRIVVKNLNQNPNDYIRTINNNQNQPYLYNHKSRYNNERDIEIFSRLNQGDKSDDPKIADIMPYANRNDIFKDKYFKLVYNAPSKTMTAHMKFDCNMYIHPEQARGLTPREAARVQSYPDGYYFKGPFTKTYMQIGNSVPPLMSRKIASVIRKYL